MKYLKSIGCLILVSFLVGCGGTELAPVSGTLKINGEPAAEVEVTYHPDPNSGNSGKFARAVTNEKGEFTLVYQDGNLEKGVPVGTCLVTLRDLAAAYSSREEVPIPSRIPLKYTVAVNTPLKMEVQSGVENEHDLNVTEGEE